MSVLWIIAGLVLLTAGAEVLVRGATGLARAAGLPSLIIGLTVVAYGTSAPEFAVSINAGLTGQADVALGNVVGSNTFNVLFILGLSALVMPLTVSSQLIRLDVPVMIGVSLLAWLIAANGSLSQIEGGLLCVALVIYTGWLIYLGKRKPAVLAVATVAETEPAPPVPKGAAGLGWAALLVIIGLALLVLGARWLVDGATSLARGMGVSELMIGLTIVAAGTSMPELATSVVASIRGERDIAVGNVVGSNIFNILGVLGMSALVAPDGIAVAAEALRFDIPVMMAVAVACLPIFFTGGRISRLEGGLFLGFYLAYVTFLVLAALQHAALPLFSAAMLWFVIPLCVLGVGLSVVLWIRREK